MDSVTDRPPPALRGAAAGAHADTQDCARGAPRADFVRKDARGSSNGALTVPLPTELRRALDALADGNAFLVYAAVFSAFAIHFRRQGDSERLVLYSPSLQDEADVRIAVPFDFGRLATFRDVLESTRVALRSAYRSRDAVRVADDGEGGATTIAMHGLHAPREPADGDLHLHVSADAGEFAFRYDEMLYRRDTVAHTAERVLGVLSAGLAAPDRRLVELWQASASEIALIRKWNDTEAAYDSESDLWSLAAATVARTPDRVACVCAGRSYTYAGLNAAALRIAAALRELGLRPGGVAAIFVGRTFAAVAAIAGTIAAGAAYLPLDRMYPARRIAYLLGDAQPDFVLAERRLLADLPQTATHVLCIEDLLEAAPHGRRAFAARTAPTAPAYLIYTSGSTGDPKGVVLDHRGRVNNFSDFNRRFGIGAGDAVLGVSSLSFDMSAYDILGTLMAGSKLVLVAEEEHSAPSEWLELIAREQVTVWHSVPSLMESLLEHAERYEHSGAVPPSLRLVLLGGDWIPVGMAARIRALWPKAEVISLGGATEVSMDSTIYAIGATQPNWKSVPYGHAMANQKAYVLDAEQRVAPVGVAGELFLGGDGVAAGYHRRPALSAAKFVPDGVGTKPGARLYATGDLARYQPDGELELLGRMDFQVKIRGLRIELGEIESALQDFPGVSRAVVLVKHDAQGATITAYVVAAQAPDGPTLRKHLAERLPYYMLPHQTIVLAELPLSANGKIDRNALRALKAEPAAESAPSATTAVVRAIFAELLSLDQAGADDDFFALGGHSLLALQLISRLEEVFRVKTPLHVVFESPTPAQLAAHIEREAATEGVDLAEIERLWQAVNRMSEEEMRQAASGQTVSGVEPRRA